MASEAPELPVHYTPVGSSWLNQVEIWFGIITRQAIRRGTFSSVRVFTQAISNYISSWNEDSAPFKWTATADEILEKVALVDRDFRKLERYSKPHMSEKKNNPRAASYASR
jgi:hypothetical protein